MTLRRVGGAKAALCLFTAALLMAASADGQTKITAWTVNTPFPEASPVAAFSHGSSILAFTNSAGYIGNVDASGIIGPWRQIAAPPGDRPGSGGRRYAVVGESVVFAAYPNSYLADFLPDGSLSPWRQSPGVNTHLNGAGNTVATDGTHIWSIGGCCYGTEPLVQDVDVATFTNGTLSAWRVLGDFPIAITAAGVRVIGSYLYVYGGQNQYGGNRLSDVRRAAILTGGNLGPWEFVGQLLEARPTGESLAHQGTLHVVAGGVHDYATKTVETVIEPNLGVAGQHVYSAPLPEERSAFGAAVVRNFGFVIGGCASAYCTSQANTVFTAVLGSADTQPPLTTATLAPQPNASGWNNTDVQVGLLAADEAGGSGVKQIQWALSGAQQGGPTVVAGATAAASITAEGHTSVTYFATDNGGNVEATQLLDVNIDKTAPVLTVPANIVVDATGPAGATVSFVAAATDNLDPSPAVTCAPAQGLFAIGTATVNCTASDKASNTSTKSFTVTVRRVVQALGPVTFWVGLKNSDDQGTQFDVRTELYKNGGTLLSAGQSLCITGVTRNPDLSTQVGVLFGAITNGDVKTGDVLSLKVLTRIGTNPDGNKCPGPGGSHSNAVGLRLYYDATSRMSRVGAAILPDPMLDNFLHSGSTDFLDRTAPTGATPKYKDSPAVNFAGGNPWREIGAWSMPVR